MELYGVEVIANNDSSYSCASELTLAGLTYPLSSVQFSSAVTPKLEVVSPRSGSERGSESVTFTGTGFVGAATVMIDDLPCEVTD